MTDITTIFSKIDRGDPAASEQLLPRVYDELRRLAAAKLAQEKVGKTLQATALVHEACLRFGRTGGPATVGKLAAFLCVGGRSDATDLDRPSEE